MKNRQQVGEGKTAKLYLEEGYVYKTYPADYPTQWIEWEATVQQEVQKKTNLLLPKAIFDKERRELKMEFLEGCTLAERMRKEKYKFAVEDLVALQLSVYQYKELNLEQAHEIFEKQLQKARLESQLKEKALDLLKKIEIKTALCHFDLHFLNIMYSYSDYYLIDWVNAKLGNPVLDIARTYIILKQYTPRLANKYLNMIVKQGNFCLEEVKQAIPLLAILRLSEADTEDFSLQLFDLINANG